MITEQLEQPMSEDGVLPRDPSISVVRSLSASAGGLLLIAVLVASRRLWAAEALLVAVLLVVPGIMLLRALRIPSKAVAEFPIYVPCASLVVLLGSGLVVDLVGPFVGVTQPIRAVPMLIGLESTCILLLASSVKAPCPIQWHRPSRSAAALWSLVLPLIAAAGALRLNNGYGNGVALIALFGSLLLLVFSVVAASRLDKMQSALFLYSIGLALMWSFSLRGDLVYGFDIAAEYNALHQTVSSGVWHTAHYGDAYGAMLSVTVMPAELHALSGVSALLVFKLIYPVIGALFPVGVFGLARRLLPRHWAFAAAGLVVVQSTFFQELPALARQEIALSLFVALVAAVLDGRISRYSQAALVALLALAMVVSHYSTTYMAVGIFGLTLIFQFVTFWLKHVWRVTLAVAVAFAASLLGAVVWYGPVTHSTSNVTEVVSMTGTQGLDLLPNQAQDGGGLLGAMSAYFQYTTQAPIQPMEYEKLIHDYYSHQRPFVSPFADAGNARYDLRSSSPAVPAVRSRMAYSTVSLAALLIQQLVNVLGIVGALMMVIWRKSVVIAREVGLISVATIIVLAAIRLSGTLANLYNPERAFLQGTVVIAISLCWSMYSIAGRWKMRRREEQGRLRRAAVLGIATGSLVILFVTSTGFVGAILGGGTATNLSNSGEDYERYGMTAPELASAAWLGGNIKPGQLVYADRYAQLPLVAIAGAPSGLLLDVTPMTLSQQAWIYADSTNVTDDRARSIINGQIVTYVYPFGFIRSHYYEVFTDGSSEVFYK
jgi:uncharacterized membrane protein